MLLLSAVVFYGVMAYYVSLIHFLVTPPVVIYNYLAYLLASIIYIVATVLFLTVSYPDAYDKFMYETASADVTKMTFMERYISGNMLLIASWLIFFATLPIIVYPCWAMAEGNLEYLTGCVYLITVFFILLFLGFFIVACFPENLALNGGRGSSMLYDVLFSCPCCDTFCCCFGGKAWLQTHFGNDLLASLWLIVLGSIFCLALAVYYVVVNSKMVVSYMWLLSSLFFTIGSYLFVYTFYHENYGSTICFDFLTCSKSERRVQPNYFESVKQENEEDAEDERRRGARREGLGHAAP